MQIQGVQEQTEKLEAFSISFRAALNTGSKIIFCHLGAGIKSHSFKDESNMKGLVIPVSCRLWKERED